jgi:peptidoglycan/LPS O-acetylase OafA/YrhL
MADELLHVFKFSGDTDKSMPGVMDIPANVEEHKQQAFVPGNTKLRPPFKASRRIPELDGLRGLAIGMVVLVHYVWFAYLIHPTKLSGLLYGLSRPLWSAVDLFFVLSGFLIGGNLLDSHNCSNYFSQFYIRRFCRLLPVYFLFVGFAAVVYRFVYHPIGSPVDIFFDGRLPWLAYLTFGQNLWMAKLNRIGPLVLAITWAFAVEVQFYFVMPAIIRLVRSSALPYICIAGIVAAPFLRLYFVYGFKDNLWATYLLLPSRMDSLLMGLLCAYCVRRPKIWAFLNERPGAVWKVLLTLFVGTPVLITNGIPFTLMWVVVGYGWTALFYSAILILVLTNFKHRLSRVFRSRVLTGLGSISYGVYLFHTIIYSLCMWLFFRLGFRVAGWNGLGATALILAITLGFSKLSWEYFEKPIIRWSHDARLTRESALHHPTPTAIPATFSVTELHFGYVSTQSFFHAHSWRRATKLPTHSSSPNPEILPPDIGLSGRP